MGRGYGLVLFERLDFDKIGFSVRINALKVWISVDLGHTLTFGFWCFSQHNLFFFSLVGGEKSASNRD